MLDIKAKCSYERFVEALQVRLLLMETNVDETLRDLLALKVIHCLVVSGTGGNDWPVPKMCRRH